MRANADFAPHADAGQVLPPEALELVASRHHTFQGRRLSLLGARAERQARLSLGGAAISCREAFEQVAPADDFTAFANLPAAEPLP